MKILNIVLLTLLSGVVFICCKKELSIENGNTGLTAGTWQFQVSPTQYTGNIDSAVIRDGNGTKVLTLAGKSINGQEKFKIELFTTGSFTATTYPSSSFNSNFEYGNPAKTIFKADYLGGEFIVTITSLSNNKITGIFSGEVEDSTGAQTLVTLGSFTSSIDLSNNGTQALGTLGANPDSCSPITISGNYTAGIPLTATNTVQVQVNVTTTGSFNIATNSVNGVRFFKIGTFNTVGLKNLILDGEGIPQVDGRQTFSVTFGNSHCIFEVNFQPGTTPTGDYLPTTIGSSWTFGLEAGGTTDSILLQVIPYAPTLAGHTFTSFTADFIPPTGSPDTSYFRKAANEYFTYLDVSDFFGFDDPVYGEYIFLKDAVPAGTTYRSPNFNGTISGTPTTGFIEITIDEKAVPVNNFSDVIKVTYEYFITSLPGFTLSTEDRWYARDVGLIYDNIDNIFILNIGQ